MTARLPDAYFDRMYAGADDPWQLSTRWYEQRKYAITLAMLPDRRYRHAFEPGCSIGTLTAQLARRCDHVTAMDVADAALRSADARLREAGCRDRVTLIGRPWTRRGRPGPSTCWCSARSPTTWKPTTLAEVLRRECPRLQPGAKVVAAHWRHPVADYPLTGDAAHADHRANARADVAGLLPRPRCRRRGVRHR